jgi:hypothetical protein
LIKVHVHSGPLVVWIGQKPIEGGTPNNEVTNQETEVGQYATNIHPALHLEIPIHRMVIEAFATIKNMQEVGEDLNLTIGQPLEDPIDEAPMNLHTQEDHGSFMEILFEGSSTSMLSALLMLLNLKTVHGVSTSFMDELLALLWKELLPKGNKLLATT